MCDKEMTAKEILEHVWNEINRIESANPAAKASALYIGQEYYSELRASSNSMVYPALRDGKFLGLKVYAVSVNRHLKVI